MWSFRGGWWRGCGHGRRRGRLRVVHAAEQLGVPRVRPTGRGRRGGHRGLFDAGHLHDVGGVARHHQPQPVPGLGLDVIRILLLRTAVAQLRNVGLEVAALLGQLGRLRALAQIGAGRHRRSAPARTAPPPARPRGRWTGPESGARVWVSTRAPVGTWTFRRTAAPASSPRHRIRPWSSWSGAVWPAARRRCEPAGSRRRADAPGGNSPTATNGGHHVRRDRHRAVRSSHTSKIASDPHRGAAGSPPGIRRPRRGHNGSDGTTPRRQSAGTQRPRRSGPHRRARPRCAAAGCTWPPAR